MVCELARFICLVLCCFLIWILLLVWDWGIGKSAMLLSVISIIEISFCFMVAVCLVLSFDSLFQVSKIHFGLLLLFAIGCWPPAVSFAILHLCAGRCRVRVILKYYASDGSFSYVIDWLLLG